MSATSAGEQWLDDAPRSWRDVQPYPPLATGICDAVDVLDHGTVSVFRLEDSATCWLQVPDDLVVDVDDMQ